MTLNLVLMINFTLFLHIFSIIFSSTCSFIFRNTFLPILPSILSNTFSTCVRMQKNSFTLGTNNLRKNRNVNCPSLNEFSYPLEKQSAFMIGHNRRKYYSTSRRWCTMVAPSETNFTDSSNVTVATVTKYSVTCARIKNSLRFNLY